METLNQITGLMPSGYANVDGLEYCIPADRTALDTIKEELNATKAELIQWNTIRDTYKRKYEDCCKLCFKCKDINKPAYLSAQVQVNNLETAIKNLDIEIADYQRLYNEHVADYNKCVDQAEETIAILQAPELAAAQAEAEKIAAEQQRKNQQLYIVAFVVILMIAGGAYVFGKK